MLDPTLPLDPSRLPPKLQRTLDRLRASPNGMCLWLDAPKQHERLRQLGLVTEGTDGERRIAVLVTPKIEKELREVAWVLHSPYPDGTWRGEEKCVTHAVTGRVLRFNHRQDAERVCPAFFVCWEVPMKNGSLVFPAVGSPPRKPTP